MIRKSFIFLEKVSKGKERLIWKQEIKDWQDFLQAKKVKGISAKAKSAYDRKIKEAQIALKEEDANYFNGKLPQKEIWRLYDYFKEDCCFLDIEIDGYGQVILVGISDYYNSNFFVKGINLGKANLEKELNKYKMIITFNGSSFDLPKLRKLEINFKQAHLDLKPLCVNLGLKGGLKEVEKILDLRRPKHLYGNPVQLWKAFHASGDREYLDLLIEYNREDVENLKMIADKVYQRLKGKL